MLDYINSQEGIHTIVTIGSMILFCIGLFGLLVYKMLIKLFISISIMEASLFIFFIGLSYNPKSTAPILSDGLTTFTAMQDPIPQALILTAIVICMAVLALGVSFAIEYYKLTSSSDISKMKILRK